MPNDHIGRLIRKHQAGKKARESAVQGSRLAMVSEGRKDLTENANGAMKTKY